jgi:hypothetical protein
LLLSPKEVAAWGLDRGGDACSYGRLYGTRCDDWRAAHFNRAGRKACAGDRQSSRTDHVLVSLPLLRRARRRRDAPQNAGAARASIPCAGERRREDFRCGFTEDLGNRMAARGYIENFTQRGERAGTKRGAGRNAGRRGPAPHIRRAHWHTFWTGPRSGAPRKPALKWIPPIPVAFGDVEPDTLPAVIHRVST